MAFGRGKIPTKLGSEKISAETLETKIIPSVYKNEYRTIIRVKLLSVFETKSNPKILFGFSKTTLNRILMQTIIPFTRHI